MGENNTKIPKRSEISSEYKWKLEHIYADNDLWENDFKRIITMSSEISKFKNTLSKISKNLLDCLNLNTDIQRLLEKLYVYAQMKSHEDTTNSYYQSLAGRSDSLLSEISSSVSFITPEILSISNEVLERFLIENKDLQLYKKYLNEIVRSKAHVLSQEEEQLLSMSLEVANSPSNIFNMINNADMKFPYIKDENQNDVELTKGRYISFMESSDRRVRKDAFDALYSTYKKQINTIAATLSANVKSDIFNSKARKYPSAREASLFPDNIPDSVYDNLIDVINNNMPLMHRYVSIRKKMLGLNELHMYDLYTPIVQGVDIKIPFTEAVNTVKEALSVLGPDYIKDLNHGFSSGWIDIYENEGKRSGAYSWGCYDSHPYVLLNYTNTLNDMFTLAHEMGHAMHSFYSNKNQPYLYSGYKIFVAEVASTFNESILMMYLLKKTTDKKQKMYLINHYLESFRGTVFRQTMFAEFEKIIHEKSEASESLTAELLSSIYHELNVKYYGPDIIVDDYIDIEWARIPHFYQNFYVYKYATGFSAATSLSNQVLKYGEPALNKYLNFLKSGDSDYPIELLKNAGVDMTVPSAVQDGLKVFEYLLNEFETLSSDL